MMYMSKISAVVIIYNPSNEVLQNVKTNSSFLSKVFVIDNSERQNEDITNELKSIKNIDYHWNGCNLGIGYCLNIAAMKSIKLGFEYILTLDQDSRMDDKMVDTFNSFLINYPLPDEMGILAPIHIYQNFNRKYSNTPQMVLSIITSGSLISLKAFLKAGNFLEDYFIDYVDFEYCLRLNAAGYKIIQVPNAILHHKLGELSERRFLFTKIAVTNHSPIRMYYRTRNRFCTYKKYLFQYPVFVVKDVIVFFNELIKIGLYETEKTKKIKMVLKGFFDFLRNRSGVYIE